MQKEYLRYKSEEMLIAKKLVDIGVEQKKSKITYRGWVCGTYTSSIRRALAEFLHRRYGEEPMSLKLLCHKWGLYENNKRAEIIEKEADLLEINLETLEKSVLELVPNVRINPSTKLTDFL